MDSNAQQPVTAPPVPPDGPRVRGGRTWSWLRRFAKLWGFALFCIFVVYIFRQVALPFLFAILVAYILAPLVDRFERISIRGRPFPRGLAVIILYVNIIALLVLFVSYFIPKLSSDFARLFREAPQLIARVNKEWVPRAGAWIDDRFGAEPAPATTEPVVQDDPVSPDPGGTILIEPLPEGKLRVDLEGVHLEVHRTDSGGFVIHPPRPAPADTGEGKWERSIKQWIAERVKSTEGESKRALEWGQKFVTAVVTGIARLVLVLMVAAFILVDLARIRLFLRSLVPDHYQQDYDRILVGVDKGLSGVIRGQLLICLINGVLTYIGLLLFDVKYSLLLGGLASVMSLVPIFGSVLSSIPIVAIALISSGTFDLSQGVKVLGWIIGIHLVEANYLNPKIMGDAAKIHPVLVVFALIAGEHSYGLVGALFAVPVASIIQTMFVYFRRRGPVPRALTPPPRASASEIAPA